MFTIAEHDVSELSTSSTNGASCSCCKSSKRQEVNSIRIASLQRKSQQTLLEVAGSKEPTGTAQKRGKPIEYPCSGSAEYEHFQVKPRSPSPATSKPHTTRLKGSRTVSFNDDVARCLVGERRDFRRSGRRARDMIDQTLDVYNQTDSSLSPPPPPRRKLSIVC